MALNFTNAAKMIPMWFFAPLDGQLFSPLWCCNFLSKDTASVAALLLLSDFGGAGDSRGRTLNF